MPRKPTTTTVCCVWRETGLGHWSLPGLGPSSPGPGLARLAWALMRLSHRALVPGCRPVSSGIGESWHRPIMSLHKSEIRSRATCKYTVTRCAMWRRVRRWDEKKISDKGERGRVISNGLSIRTSRWFSPLYHSVIWCNNKFSRIKKIQHFLRKKRPAQQIWTTAGNDIYWLITLQFLL